MDFYLDAVLYPRCITKEGWWALRQEGWHYDIVSARDDQNLTDNEDRVKFEYKGVVFSEMKGAYSSQDRLLVAITDSMLFPDSPYRFDSGGDPTVIPTLTREEFGKLSRTHV